ncbi:hypothetical protein AVHY2522_23255 [Acidovorax sp. SUPP2522]|uniref:MHYT domain-containing protein n=1 Tax=unclassified Acidovorax TaxID=2684926 RepID=UPI00234A098B|nr:MULTISPECIES: MHYT domain-containing protein [unclassified Acidovorax]WCN00225.1 hypothetical protein M5C96_12975 [Acidovorax sp. GBBC 1281]GKT19651.1 hypothetical protein AVHY2522_23255 [Acidovorax sp. SUPP2522]
MLERFFLLGESPADLLVAQHDPWLLLLSVAVAVATSTLALHLAGQARLTHEPVHRTMALATSAVALGAGIWAMHFIGMLAFTLCVAVRYDVGITLLSMLPGLAASWVALNVLVRQQVTGRQLAMGGLLVGAGIGAMHYAGMEALRMAPDLRYDPAWFAASIVVAVVLAVLALWVRFTVHQRSGMSNWQATLLSGSIMGMAISGMHYTAMAAARFVGQADPELQPGRRRSR